MKVYSRFLSMKTYNPGESIKVRVPEEFELHLSVQATSGYEWKVAEKATGLSVLGSSFKPPTDDRIGGASLQVLRLRADEPGTLTLRLVCKRAWDTTPSETLVLQITAQDRV
ncbi:MAG TPA: protease inhibitor I42 family protein [Dissulfurispiraceae bacterium]|nr:protease inhibitor I42 family protein [Dissulfurispiraceae bacterium]